LDFFRENSNAFYQETQDDKIDIGDVDPSTDLFGK